MCLPGGSVGLNTKGIRTANTIAPREIVEAVLFLSSRAVANRNAMKVIRAGSINSSINRPIVRVSLPFAYNVYST